MSWVVTGIGMDPDAETYLRAVETADAAGLEPAVRAAVNTFVKGCKSDGIWSAIKASCILAGARTRAGALVPLVGTAPSEAGTVGGWNYDRKTGLKANGSDNRLATNYAFTAGMQDNCSIAGYHSEAPTIGVGLIGGFQTSGGSDASFLAMTSARLYNAATNTFITSNTTSTGFRGISRSSSTTFTYRRASSNETATISSTAFTHENQQIFARYRGGTTYDSYTNARVAFFSLGESLDLAKLDTRVTTLINAFAAAIP